MGPLTNPLLRVAHYTSGAPAFNVCVKSSNSSTFMGPLYQSGGVYYSKASAYVTLPPETYTVRVVPGSASDCSTMLGGLPDMSIAPIAAGQRYTVAAMGDLFMLSTVRFVVLTDDFSMASGQARLRFLHAASMQGNLDFGSGSGSSFAPLFTGTSYGSLGQASGNQTYLDTAAENGGAFSLRQSGSSTDLVTVNLTLNANEVYTVTAEGILGNASTPLDTSLCDDTAPPVSGLSVCTEVSD
jgi:hypothetical protein